MCAAGCCTGQHHPPRTPWSRFVKVEIWSDVVCPWCQIGKRRFEKALSRFRHRDQVEIIWKSFELDPTAESQASDDRSGSYAHRLAAKYGMGLEQAEQMLASMTATAAAEGLDFRFDRAVHANTFLAHQVIHLAREHGLQDAMKDRLLTAYFTEGRAVGDPQVLASLAAEVGLDRDDVLAALDEGRHAPAVRADQDEARAFGITGVPFFVVDRTFGVSGAQPPETFLELLEQAWAKAHPLTMVGASETGSADGACGPDGCPV
jgi:predicted DsbA family dithiol-disulfide isomerase